jgi:hypothetical protein
LVGKLEGTKSLGEVRCSWEDNIKMDNGERRIGRVKWINLAQERHQWRYPVHTVMNLWVL